LQMPGFRTREADASPLHVLSVSPPSLSLGVSVRMHPSVTFSREVSAASVNSTSVALLDILGRSVPQASGSPSLSSNGTVVTIVPAEDLAHLAGYRIRVLNEENGVRATDGSAMADTFVQIPGFTTGLDDAQTAVLSVTPEAGTLNVLVNVHPTVTFATSMQSSTLTA